VRPVFFVSDVERALGFYVSQLGFAETNRYAEEGVVLVGGVARDGCPLLLSARSHKRLATVATGSSWMSLHTTDFAPISWLEAWP
jgi:catechol 2,3-dioxygenase-like lactoylglutathione lyase family enzyme